MNTYNDITKIALPFWRGFDYGVESDVKRFCRQSLFPPFPENKNEKGACCAIVLSKKHISMLNFVFNKKLSSYFPDQECILN